MSQVPAEGELHAAPAPEQPKAAPTPVVSAPAEPSPGNDASLPLGAPGGRSPQGGPPGDRQGRHKRRRRKRRGGGGGGGGGPQPQRQNSNGGAPAGGEGEAAGQARAQQQTAPAEGILDFDGKGGFGFLRQLKRNMLEHSEDPEIPRFLIQKLRLRPGQTIQGVGFQRGNRIQLNKIEAVDGMPPEEAVRYPQFQDLTVVDPLKRIQLEHASDDMVTRVLDLVAPIGFGQRGLIVSPPKAGKTIMLQRIAQAISENHPSAHLMVLLVDERPEEVTDMRRSISGEVFASSSDRPTSDHLQVAEMCLDRARRLVEHGKDVVILLDSITRLARAYNKEVESSGRTLTGGVDSRALERPKRIFGSARKTEEAGSLTILGTALVDTGSRMDEVIFEEFKGTGNMEVTLDRALAEKRIFPAISIPSSGTRKEEKLMTPKEYEKVRKLRQMLSAMKPSDAMEKLVKKLTDFETNDEFLDAV